MPGISSAILQESMCLIPDRSLSIPMATYMGKVPLPDGPICHFPCQAISGNINERQPGDLCFLSGCR
ncbi:unnamed protein product [Victoria cruziana]